MNYNSLVAFVMGMFAIISIIGIVFWIVQSIPLYKMAKNADIDNAWLAWIPIGNIYVLNALGGDTFDLWNGKIHFDSRINAFWLVLALSFGGGLLAAIPIIGSLCSLAASIVCFCIQWRMIYDMMNAFNPNADNMAVSIVATIIVIVYIVILWMYCNRTPVYTTNSTFDASYNN